MASLIPKKPHPRGLYEFRPISCLTTFRNLRGYIWLLELPHLSWKTLQTAFIPHRQASEAVYKRERCTELAREWSISVFNAQLDLQRAFDRIFHGSIAEMCPQLVAVLRSWWCCSSLGSPFGTRDLRSLYLGGPGRCRKERLRVLWFSWWWADEILGGLRPSWERRNFAWTCDAVSLSCLGYANDVLLFSGSKASLETMIEDCCTKCGEAGLEVGLDKNPLEQFHRNGWRNAGGAWPEYCVGTEAGVYWVSDRARCTQWWSSEASHAKGVLSLLQVEISLVQSEPVLERENESVWGEHSFECYVAEWLLDSFEATRTSVRILVRTSLEPDGGFQA